MDIKTRFNALHKVASVISEQAEIYSATPVFVEGRLVDPEVVRAFRTLKDKLNKQLDNLRKQCK